MAENCENVPNSDAENVIRDANSNDNQTKTETLPTCTNDDDGEHERWTYPLDATAVSMIASDCKQLSYVHRMAQKFEELAEARHGNWCLNSGTYRRVFAKGNDADEDDDDDDDDGAHGERMLRSRSLIEIIENRHRSNENNDDGVGGFSSAIRANYEDSANETVIDEPAVDNIINNDNNDDDGMYNVPSDEQIDHQDVENSAADSSVDNEHDAELIIQQSTDDSEDVQEEMPLTITTNPENADEFSLCEEISENYNGFLETRNPAFAEPPINDDDADIDEHDDSFDSFTSSEDEHDASLSIRPDSLASTTSARLANILEELLENEKTYVTSLTNGIQNYMTAFDEKDLPGTLRGHKYHMFGNLHRIKDFHELDFYPALQKCNRDVTAISNTFYEFIQKDYFYGYILYAINRYRSEQIFEQNRAYFKERQNKIDDKLGLNSFLVQPIQRLPKYKLLLNQLISELGKNLEEDGVKLQIAACCKAEKNLQRLLDTVNESMNINDIVDCNDIYPHHQGKFQKVDEFIIFDVELRRRYKGKVFLFDKCVIFTETLNKQKLFYRGYFRHETMGFSFRDGKNNFNLYVGRPGNQEIEFSASATITQLWMQLLTNILMKTVVVEKKKKMEERHRTRHSKSDLGPVNVLMRLNSPSLFSPITESVSTWSSSGSSTHSFGSTNSRESSFSTCTTSTQNSDMTNRTTWYTKLEDDRKATESLLNSEKYFIQLMSKATKDYLTNIPDEVQLKLLTFLNGTKQILAFHLETFYPALTNCDLNISSICDVFKRHMEAKSFHIYNVYAAYVREALGLLASYLSPEEGSENRDEYLREMDHALMMPIKQLENYTILLEALLNEFKEKDFITEQFKTVANVEIEIKKLFKSVSENFNINSLRGSANCVRTYGLAVYSDTITVDAGKYRILILEKGLICVKIRISTKTKKEKFVEQYFAIPLTATLLLENEMYPKRLKVSANYAKHITFVLHFATTRKKKQLIETVRAQQRLD